MNATSRVGSSLWLPVLFDPALPVMERGMSNVIYLSKRGESTAHFAIWAGVAYLPVMTSTTPDAIIIGLKHSLEAVERHVLTIDGFRPAGVLVPLLLTPAGTELLLTRRTESVETHKGQIAFPGGMADPADGDIVATALREAWEELGIPSSAVQVIGILDDLPTPSGFIITPVVGAIRTMPALVPNPHEVEEVFQVPLDFFRDPMSGRVETREFRGKNREVWFYERGPHTVWGATAMIIRSLLERLKLV